MDKLLFLLLLTYFGLKPVESIELVDIEGKDLIKDDITGWDYGNGYVRISFNEDNEQPLLIARIICKDCESDKPTITPKVANDVLKLQLSDGQSHDDDYQWSLYVNGRIDYENMDTSYEFTMNIGSSVTYLLTINNIDNKPPMITTNNRDCTVKETPIGVGDTKCVYHVTDPDGNDFIDTIIFDFIKLSSEEIIKKFGYKTKILEDLATKPELNKYIEVTLTVKEALDFETVPLYFFNLRATDSGKNTYEYPVIVNIEDIPDTPPKWTLIFASKTFDEEGVEKFDVKAIDGDTQIDPISPIEYKIDFTGTDKQFEKISIDEKGEIISNKIDRDTLNKSLNDIIEFKLTATETLQSCDFPPEVKSCPAHTDSELTKEVCEDCGGKWINMYTEAKATFIIRDINDNKAQVHDLKDIIIPENRTLIYDEQKLAINDIDLGINAQCSIKLIENCNVAKELYDVIKVDDAFQLIPSTGFEEWESQISIIKTILDYENPDMRKFTLSVHTEDFQKNETCDTKINIIVENRNDEIPVFYDCGNGKQKTDFVFSIEEIVGKGTEIGRVCAFDNDIDDSITFDLVASSTKESFEIETFDDKGIIIKTKKDKTFDFETMPEVVINIKATDTLKTKYDDLFHTEFATVTIHVIEVNYKPPRISLNNETKPFEENIPPGTIVAGEEEGVHEITATDPNTMAVLNFTINWEESWATKQGRKADQKDFFDCLRIETYSNTPGNPGDTKNVYARLVVQSIGKDQNGNDITIDYEKYEFLYLKIKVTDENQTIGTNFDTVTISLQIEDVNDNPPIFDKKTIEAKRSVIETDIETTSIITVGTIIATDADGPKYNKVYYYVTPINVNSKYQDVIKINEETGELYMDVGVKVDADKYCDEGLEYEVRATDIDHNTTANFHIDIIDTNNKFPKWVNKIDEIDPVPENVTHRSLIKLIAKDEDCEELFRTVVFVLNDLSLANIFKVDKIGGEVSISCKDESKKCMDRDGTNGINGHDYYDISIQLQDMNGTGDYKKTDYSFRMPVEDVNDNAPILQDKDLNNIKENAEIDYPLGTITAIDIDKPNTPNSEIEYHIVNVYRKTGEEEEVEIDKDLLKINDITGDLKTNKAFRDYFGTIIVEIIALDHGDPQLSNSKNYSFEVSKYNFEKPSFLFPLDEIILSKDQVPFSKLITSEGKELNPIKATDNQKEKYKISFKIISEKPQSGSPLFELHSIQSTHLNIADLWITKERSENDPIKYEVVFEASHDGVGEINKVQIKTSITFIDPGVEPYFDKQQEECKFHETFINETCDIVPAFDPKGKDNIYYYLYKSDGDIFEVMKAPLPGKGTKLNVKVGLDIEDRPSYTVYIRASSLQTKPAIDPKNPKSVLTVPVGLIDINNHPPKFEKKLWTVGLSEQDEPNKVAIITLNATDVDEVDEGKLKYEIISDSLKANNDDLMSIKNPFTVKENGEIFNNFKPTDGMEGFFTFDVRVTDTPPQSHTDNASVKVSIISEAVRVSFIFNNTEKEIKDKQELVEGIFQQVFGYKCTLDSINLATDDSGNVIDGQVRVKFHFMNDKEETINKDEIIKKSNDLNNIAMLRIEFDKIGLKYMSKNSNNENSSNDTGKDFQKLKIIFIVVTIILALACIILIIAFVIKTKSLSRRLDAMNVPIFGSTNSGLNRIGTNAPGTNRHAVEANPVYHTDIKTNFDTISQGSGDSELIGIEDSKDFDIHPDIKKSFMEENVNFKPTLNPLAAAPTKDDLDDIFI